jgi:predicted negative regulator of RcsB-dependent stress response
MPAPATRPRPAEERSQQLRDLAAVHRGKLLAALVVVVALLAGAWLYVRSVALKRERAETAYYRARQAGETGNVSAASAELGKVADRYKGTPGGILAAISLAQLHYDSGKHRDGLQVLLEVEDSAPDEFESSVHLMKATGYENLRQFAEAAGEYQRAAETARFPSDALSYKGAAARALTAAGRNNEALAIWRELADEPSGLMAAEARVRIGELTARAAEPSS